MMQPIEIWVPGEPRRQPRPRARAMKIGQRYTAQVYNPKDADEWKGLVVAAARTVFPESLALLSCPLRVDVRFYMPRPKSHYRSVKKQPVLRDDAPTMHVSTPDRDNLDKAVLDALTGVIWVDDSQACDGRVSKRYDDGRGPGCHITISELLP